MGRNLCCKVQTRCPDLVNGVCSIHETKPFSCALFPIELIRVGNKRIVASAGNPILHKHNWTRFDRDMLRCFEGEIKSDCSMFEFQLPVLKEVLTPSELAVIGRALESYLEGKAVEDD
jgi:Fe-S-cluster containining protein